MNDRIIRIPEAEKITGLSKSTIWRLERDGKFPKRIKLSSYAVGWRLSQIEEFLNNRPEAEVYKPERFEGAEQ